MEGGLLVPRWRGYCEPLDNALRRSPSRSELVVDIPAHVWAVHMQGRAIGQSLAFTLTFTLVTAFMYCVPTVHHITSTVRFS